MRFGLAGQKAVVLRSGGEHPNHPHVFPAFIAGISDISIRSQRVRGTIGDTGHEGRQDDRVCCYGHHYLPQVVLDNMPRLMHFAPRKLL